MPIDSGRTFMIAAFLTALLLGVEIPELGSTPGVVRVQNSEAQQFQEWLGLFRSRAKAAGLQDATLDKALKGLRFNSKIIALDRKQSDFTRTIAQYLNRAVSRDRIAAGQKMLRKYPTLLGKIEDRYGVDREIIVAIWGLETSYGGFRGKSRTISSLATLAFDARRSAFFEAELIAALEILQNGDVGAENMIGSWAGAMGHTQFMPSSFNAHAVDFDDDGRRDIWSNDPTDSLASTAAYLRHFGWKKAVPWAVEVRLPKEFDLTLANPDIHKSAKAWRRLGVRGAEDILKGNVKARLYLPAGVMGPALLISRNFDALQKYNITPTYVMSVGLLADVLRGRGGLQTTWPASARLLSLAERKDMQERLRSAGFDPGRLDGKVDGGFIRAVQGYQTAKGLPPDGFPSFEMLQRLRNGE